MQTHLDVAHRVIYETLEQSRSTPTRLDERVADFDGASYHIFTPTSKTIILISMRWACFSQLVMYGANDLLFKLYGDMITSTEQNYDITLTINLESIEESNAKDVFTKVSLLKRHTLSAPFLMAFNTNSLKLPIVINYRPQEGIYIVPSDDRVAVIFSTYFKDDTDKILGRIFLQEFFDARKNGTLGNAPQVIYSPKTVPGELNLLNISANDNMSWVTFVLFPRHYAKEKKEDTISKIQLFRDYLHYHVKCSKSYMHSRMRSKVDVFCKVLQRAKIDAKEKGEDRKMTTMSGKTFRRA